jgi:hypothetical protein
MFSASIILQYLCLASCSSGDQAESKFGPSFQDIQPLVVDIGRYTDKVAVFDGFGRQSTCDTNQADLGYATLVGISSDGKVPIWRYAISNTVARTVPGIYVRRSPKDLELIAARPHLELLRYRIASGVIAGLQRPDGSATHKASWRLWVSRKGSPEAMNTWPVSGSGEMPLQLSISDDDSIVLSRNDDILRIEGVDNRVSQIGTGRDASLSADGRFLSWRAANDTLSVRDLRMNLEVFSSSDLIEGGVEWAPHLPIGIVRVRHRWLITPNAMSWRRLFVINAATKSFQELVSYNLGYATFSMRWMLSVDKHCGLFR